MKEVFEKIIERLEEETYSWNEGYRNGIYNAIEIVNQVAEEYNKPRLTPEQRDACWAHSSKDCSKCGQCYVPEINVGENEEFCEWFKYDYRTIAPKNHDIENPYWRMPEDMGKLKFCPYCGKKIKVVE